MSFDARALAKASGAAQRAYGPVAQLVRATDDLPLTIRRQAVAVIEELDLLRHYLREATLERVIARNETAAEAPRVKINRVLAKRAKRTQKKRRR